MFVWVLGGCYVKIRNVEDCAMWDFLDFLGVWHLWIVCVYDDNNGDVDK